MKTDKHGSNALRRIILRKAGWKPNAGMTMLTKIAYWTAPDGRFYTEEDAVRILKLRAKLLEGKS